MFVERNVFHLKFGVAKEAISLWKDYLQQAQRQDNKLHLRLLSDLTGRAYTIVLELVYDEYAELEPSKCLLTKLQGWKEFYSRFVPLCAHSERTLYKVEVVY